MIKVYIAMNKETGKVMTGARGQVAFGDAGSLRKSIGADWTVQRDARFKGCKPKDLYDVLEYELNLSEGVVGK
jgi:hypothetical protein